MNLEHQQNTATKLPKNLVHVVISLLIGYSTASVLTSHNLTNWATQLPVNQANQEVERLLQKHAKRSAKLGGDAITQKLESNFNYLHEISKKPIEIEPFDSTKRNSATPPIHAQRPKLKVMRSEAIGTVKMQTAPISAKSHDSALLIGDSLMAGIGPILSKELLTKQHLKPQLVAKIGTGLARPDRYNWTRVLKEEFKNQRFKITVILLGTNDTQNIKIGKKGVLFGGPAWHRIYKERVEELMTAACRGSDAVFWLGLPTMRDPEFHRRASHLNTVIKSVAKSYSCIRYIDLDEPSADAAYTAYASLGVKQIKVRAPDGIHYTPAGAKLLTTFLLKKLQYSRPSSTKDTITASVRKIPSQPKNQVTTNQ